MEAEAAVRTLELLADGRDPATGLSLPEASPFNQPAVVRSLYAAIRALESGSRRADQTSGPQSGRESDQVTAGMAAGGQSPVSRAPSVREQPANAGKPWTAEEDAMLCAAFDAGIGIKVLSGKHGRSTTALNARLFKLGKIADPGIPLRHPVTRPAGQDGRQSTSERRGRQASGAAAA